ncbi:hypothetical protein HDV00_009694 [Rhizophlyctis rosea]|nr:hypothetical protein HDV00_009694 [Rhizophlyctis rosea]
MDTFKAMFDSALLYGTADALVLFNVTARHAEIHALAPFKEYIYFGLQVLMKGVPFEATPISQEHRARSDEFFVNRRAGLIHLISHGLTDPTPRPTLLTAGIGISQTPNFQPLPNGQIPWFIASLVAPTPIRRSDTGHTTIDFNLTEDRFDALVPGPLSFRVRLNLYLPQDLSKRPEWPFFIARIELNGLPVTMERKTLVQYPEGQRILGKNRAVDISTGLKLGVNRLVVRYQQSHEQVGKEYRLEVEFLKYLMKDVVEAHVKCSVRAARETEERVQSMLRGGDDEIQQETVPIDLRCPLTLTRVNIPARGLQCTHLQCFDLNNLLESAASVEIPPCPACGRRLTADALCIDQYFVDLLEKVPRDVTQISMRANGEWTVVEREEGEEEDEPMGGADMGGNERVEQREEEQEVEARPVKAESGVGAVGAVPGLDGVGSAEAPILIIDDDEDDMYSGDEANAGGDQPSGTAVEVDAAAPEGGEMQVDGVGINSFHEVNGYADAAPLVDDQPVVRSPSPEVVRIPLRRLKRPQLSLAIDMDLDFADMMAGGGGLTHGSSLLGGLGATNGDAGLGNGIADTGVALEGDNGPGEEGSHSGIPQRASPMEM